MTQTSGHHRADGAAQDLDTIGLSDPIVRAITEQGYSEFTPIQQQAIPPILAGKDLIGLAQTGTGKTAAFSLPIIERLSANFSDYDSKFTRALFLAPTRELAIQIAENIRAYSKFLQFRSTLVYGGAPAKQQINAMRRGVDILIATPGRLLDLVKQKHINLSGVEYFVLDEADRMFDMGFINDIKKIAALMPTERQTIMFSATMPAAVEALTKSILKNPVRIEISPKSTTAENVDQYILHVDKKEKRQLLSHILADEKVSKVIIFTRTRIGANKVSEFLQKMDVASDAIHGDKSQRERKRALDRFRSGEVRALVATDVAARGIDVDDISHVINFELPDEAESYIHRIGRTARAGAKGISLSFCSPSERKNMRDIEALIKQKIPVMHDHPFHESGGAAAIVEEKKVERSGPRRGRKSKPTGVKNKKYKAAKALKKEGDRRKPSKSWQPRVENEAPSDGRETGTRHDRNLSSTRHRNKPADGVKRTRPSGEGWRPRQSSGEEGETQARRPRDVRRKDKQAKEGRWHTKRQDAIHDAANNDTEGRSKRFGGKGGPKRGSNNPHARKGKPARSEGGFRGKGAPAAGSKPAAGDKPLKRKNKKKKSNSGGRSLL